MYVEYPSYYIAKLNINNNQKEQLRMIELKPVYQLMITIATTQLAPSPQPYTNL